MDLALLIGGAAVLLFGFVVLFGAPYLPSQRRHINTALDLLNLKPGQTLLDLGCGDGRVLKAAAGRGLQAVGYELNPLLVVVARLNTWRYNRQIRVVWGNFWRADWPKADGIFVFLRDNYMSKLHNKVVRYPYLPLSLVSVGFKIPNQPVKKHKEAVFLYQYP